MKHLTVPAWAWPSYRSWRRWGWPGQAGCGLLLLAGLGWVLGLPWLQDQVDSGERAAGAARHQALLAARMTAPGAAALAGPATFLAALPEADARPQRVAALLKLAARHGLAVQRSEYQLTADPDAGFDRYRVTLPVTAAYTDLGAFIASALATDDAMSLDALRLARELPSSPQVQAELRFTLLGRSSAGAAQGAPVRPVAAKGTNALPTEEATRR